MSVADGTLELIRYDASGDAICANPLCGGTFKAKKRTQRFCDERCNAEFHDPNNRRVRGVVKSNKLLKGGKRSVTLHFEAEADVLRLEPGKLAEIL